MSPSFTAFADELTKIADAKSTVLGMAVSPRTRKLVHGGVLGSAALAGILLGLKPQPKAQQPVGQGGLPEYPPIGEAL